MEIADLFSQRFAQTIEVKFHDGSSGTLKAGEHTTHFFALHLPIGTSPSIPHKLGFFTGFISSHEWNYNESISGIFHYLPNDDSNTLWIALSGNQKPCYVKGNFTVECLQPLEVTDINEIYAYGRKEWAKMNSGKNMLNQKSFDVTISHAQC